VADLMTSPVISCASTDSMVDVVVLMDEHHVRHLPVIDDGALVGMLSMRDIQSAWLDALDQECETLREAEAA
jgi:CBS domain-containing protein